ENDAMLAALVKKAAQDGVSLLPMATTDFTVSQVQARIRATLADGTDHATRLFVAADGARSRLRERAGITCTSWTYDQSAIVTTVAQEREHHGRAEEHFLPAGPFAILPLMGRRASIVWTENAKEAARIIALPDESFHAELESRFGLHLGEIKVIGPRRAFPI